jgi:uncharacterized protein YdiU (UPF0061 family)
MSRKGDIMSDQGWNLEHTYTNLPPIFYSKQEPATVTAPQMVVFNDKLAADLGLNPNALGLAADIFTGNALPLGANPIAQAYAGYQFGHFTMLGDGRAILLGEQITPKGGKFDIQLKGAGLTPYSRGGDGLAALLPMLREYIISEAMHHLGIPTTRSLAVAFTGMDVVREKILQGAVLTRVASSHIRVGTFDFAARFGTYEDLRKLVDYTMARHFPHISDGKDKYLLFLRETALRQASLIAKWQLAGFVHGVMNTDNMAISGETIDYGPCAFMDVYDPDTVFSSIDFNGRYAYKNQPIIGAWNLSRLAEALLPLIDENQEKAIELVKIEIAGYMADYEKKWFEGICGKLGFVNIEPQDAVLTAELLELMTIHKLDYTNTFRSLSGGEKIPTIVGWQSKWLARLGRQSISPQNAMDKMKKLNPAVIPRNHRVEEALTAAGKGDFAVMHNLLAALCNPYSDSTIYSQPPETSAKYRTFCGT